MSRSQRNASICGITLHIAPNHRIISRWMNKLRHGSGSRNLANVIPSGKELRLLGKDRSGSTHSGNGRQGLGAFCPARAIPVDVAVLVGDGADGEDTPIPAAAPRPNRPRRWPSLAPLG